MYLNMVEYKKHPLSLGGEKRTRKITLLIAVVDQLLGLSLTSALTSFSIEVITDVWWGNISLFTSTHVCTFRLSVNM